MNLCKERRFVNERDDVKDDEWDRRMNIDVNCAFAITYHCHGFATEYFDGAQRRVEGHVCENIDNRNEGARDGDSSR